MRDSDSFDTIYDFVCQNPGLNTYEIAKKLSMTGGRVRYALLRLQRMGLIEFKFQRNSSRIEKLTYPVKALKLLPRSLKLELKNFK